MLHAGLFLELGMRPLSLGFDKMCSTVTWASCRASGADSSNGSRTGRMPVSRVAGAEKQEDPHPGDAGPCWCRVGAALLLVEGHPDLDGFDVVGEAAFNELLEGLIAVAAPVEAHRLVDVPGGAVVVEDVNAL